MRSSAWHPGAIARRLAPLALALVLAACGSRPESELPAAATPAAATAAGALTAQTDRGRAIARLATRRRVVELSDARTGERLARADAGVGPYAIASDGDNYLYVTDVKLGAVLVFRVRPELRLIRRLALPGGPAAIAYDGERRRIFVTLSETGETAELRAGARIGVLRRLRNGGDRGR